ncbi:MAG: hypothetical protein FWD60_10445 [Candidatus Azobacteroides sp.]|nr:hypothetical protein [Candidatus Azobacteroides sp.]
MKKVFLLLSFFLYLSSFCTIYGQSGNVKFQQHTGFYLSMAIGPVFGDISVDDGTKYSGAGGQFDLKIGGAIKENLILHATLISNALTGPKVTYNGYTETVTDNMSINEVMSLGGGLTYYFMPNNIFVSGTVGIGSFSITDSSDSSINVSTDNGFSMQLKVGKEWWISRKWGLGVALTYGSTSVNNRPSSNINEKINSNRFGIVFNATLN